MCFIFTNRYEVLDTNTLCFLIDLDAWFFYVHELLETKRGGKA